MLGLMISHFCSPGHESGQGRPGEARPHAKSLARTLRTLNDHGQASFDGR